MIMACPSTMWKPDVGGWAIAEEIRVVDRTGKQQFVSVRYGDTRCGRKSRKVVHHGRTSGSGSITSRITPTNSYHAAMNERSVRTTGPNVSNSATLMPSGS